MTLKIIKKVSYLLLLLVMVSFHREESKLETTDTLKVISYNIWNGFDWGKDEERKRKFVNWINAQKPDVLALQELCGYTKEKLLEDAKKWGHDYAEIVKTSGYPVGITSSQPIEIKDRILEGMHHGALHCKTAGIDFLVIHFSPFSYVKRHEEAKIILKKLDNLSKDQKKYMVLGDFNALSPFDAHLYKGNKTLLSEKEASEVKHSHVRNLAQGQLEYGVLSSLLGYPLIDVTQKYTKDLEGRISFPTQVFETEKGEGRSIHATRIDYILVSPYLATKCVNSKVLNNQETFYLSDHYPVFSEFNFD